MIDSLGTGSFGIFKGDPDLTSAGVANFKISVTRAL